MSVTWAWSSGKGTKRRRLANGQFTSNKLDDDGSDDGSGIQIPIALPKLMQQSNIYSHMNHIFFNDDITPESTFALNRELRQVEYKLRMTAAALDTPLQPIYLHITTNGGCIHSAFTVVDTMKSLKVPVHTVIEGMVASAGTLISVAGETRYMTQHATALMHELRSGLWGKMTSIEEEYQNLRKMMDHIMDFYMSRTKMTRKSLEKILKKDLIWDVDECIAKGVVDKVYDI